MTKFLPPKHEYVLAVRMTPIQCKLYQYYLDHLTGKDNSLLNCKRKQKKNQMIFGYGVGKAELQCGVNYFFFTLKMIGDGSGNLVDMVFRENENLLIQLGGTLATRVLVAAKSVAELKKV